jgi:DNA repair exonuclease SbcCD ATPase subunit
MKKAFDQNVSRAKPRLRLGGVGDDVDTSIGPEGNGGLEIAQDSALGPELKALIEPVASTPASSEPKPASRESSRANGAPAAGLDPRARRERLRARLKAGREDPRPEPLPPTVAEAGVLAVERISTLQAELAKMKALNLTLTQDLEGARRQAEKATEEARLRMDEARRLASEMDARVALLSEMEKELASLEAERDEALLALQEARQTIETASHEREELKAEIAKREQALSDSLAEEERMADELESARSDTAGLRRSMEAMTSERDTLARQVSELTAERTELLEARKALEAVHRALSQAAAR